MEPEASVLGKRSRKEAVAVRRQHEHEAFRQLVNELPVRNSDLLRTTQATVLNIALSYIKLRTLLKSVNASSGLTSLLTEEELGFRGFLLVVDHTGSILHVSENFTSSLGPYIVDTIGRSITDLLHPEDARQLEGALNWRSVGNQQIFVVRMKTNMTANARSQFNNEYKKVFVICRLKNFSKMPLGRAAAEHSDSVAAVLLCRTEDLIGFPEIVMGGYIDCIYHKKTRIITALDHKTPWLLGYRPEDLNGSVFYTLDHPHDAKIAVQYLDNNAKWIREKFHREGQCHLQLPNSRIMTAWGQWLWVARDASARHSAGHSVVLKARISILGPADSHVAQPSPSSYLSRNMRGGTSIDLGRSINLDTEQANLPEHTNHQVKDGVSQNSDVSSLSATSVGSKNEPDSDLSSNNSNRSPSIHISVDTDLDWLYSNSNSSTSTPESVWPFP